VLDWGLVLASHIVYLGLSDCILPPVSAMQTCQECGEKIVGRADKKFCSDLCRNAYNNRLNADSNNLVRNINNALRKNRRILEAHCPDDKAKVSKSTLLREGFDFNYLTNVRNTQKGSTYYFVYEYGYLALENDAYLIVKDNKS
jgi:predicted nucleic acid-binding Zn ribbon protein